MAARWSRRGLFSPLLGMLLGVPVFATSEGLIGQHRKSKKKEETKPKEPTWENIRKAIAEQLSVSEDVVIPTARFGDLPVGPEDMELIFEEFGVKSEYGDVDKIVTVQDLVDYIQAPERFRALHPDEDGSVLDRRAYPGDVRYSKEHEWVKADGQDAKKVSIGLTYHAQKALGDIVVVDLPKVGTKIAFGEPLGTVESVKAVSELIAPVSGTVTEVNGNVLASPEMLNKTPYTAWMIKVALKDPLELKSLLAAADYKKLVATEKEH